MSAIHNVTTAGSGVMGSQVAWQFAFHGKDVTVYDAFDAGLEKGKTFHEQFGQEFIAKRGATEAEVQAAHGRLTYTSDLNRAVSRAELIVEQIPEHLELKREFWGKVSEAAPEEAIFCSNCSTLLPSDIQVAVSKRPERFLSFHFCVKVWESNIGEIMLTPTTDEKYWKQVIEFAREVGLVPVPIRKEQLGYVLNSLLVPFTIDALKLAAKGVADAATIDRVWRICMANVGPMEMADKMGIKTLEGRFRDFAEESGDPEMMQMVDYLKKEYVDKGKFGTTTGEGFYTYPEPEFEKDDFLS
ncbi:MAG: 3-hydroxyacyl-CoA dehydrogenase [Planctomycetaceae bacterium]